MENNLNRQALLREIQAVKFALIETKLFLDTHPCDREALEYYRCKKEKLDELLECWEKVCPRICRDNDEYRWAWVDTPWPWQVEG